MICLSNGHRFMYMVASGALAYDGKGWPWEWPLRWLGLIKPELFTVATKTLTQEPRKGYLRWWKPWECVQLLRPDSSVNKVGLTNPGIDWWCHKIGPTVDSKKIPLVVSIHGNEAEMVEMAKMLNWFDLVALELNPSCPNTKDGFQEADVIVSSAKAVRVVSQHPLIIKVSAAQQYCNIVYQLQDCVEAVSLNSVPWELLYPPGPNQQHSPLWRLQKRVGGGGGGVSGYLAQKHNWNAVEELFACVPQVPIIGPSVMRYSDMDEVRYRGASAISFGAIHLRTPWRPTLFVQRYMIETQFIRR